MLVFPTAGGDAEEIERNHLVAACGELLESGRVKLYSCDSVAGRALATGAGTPEYRMWLLNQFHQAVVNEVVPAIRADLGGADTRDRHRGRLHRRLQRGGGAVPATPTSSRRRSG